MDIRIILALLGGVIIGMALFVVTATAGLSLKEIYFLAEFWRSLRAGEYDYEDEEEEEEAPHQGQDTENNGRESADEERRNENEN